MDTDYLMLIMLVVDIITMILLMIAVLMLKRSDFSPTVISRMEEFVARICRWS